MSIKHQIYRAPTPAALLHNRSSNLIYAAPEWGSRNGELITLRIDKKQIVEVATLKLEGSGAVHISASGDAQKLVVSHYSTGSVSIVSLREDGVPAKAVTIRLSLPNAQPHGSLILGGSALVTDVAHDALSIIDHLDDGPRISGSFSTMQGDRPRSLVFLGAGQIAVANQRSNSVSCIERIGKSWQEKGRVILDRPNNTKPSTSVSPSVNGSSPVGNAGIPGDLLVLSRNLLVATNRGPDELVTISFDANCRLAILSRMSSGGKRPRSLAKISDSKVMVSHEKGPLVLVDVARRSTIVVSNQRVWSVTA